MSVVLFAQIGLRISANDNGRCSSFCLDEGQEQPVPHSTSPVTKKKRLGLAPSIHSSAVLNKTNTGTSLGH